MHEFWWGFWWLIFPIGWVVYRGWDRWLSYQRSRHALELMKQYAAQGKDPPPELMRQLQDDAYGYDSYRGWGHRYRRYRAAARRTPIPAVRSIPSTGATGAAVDTGSGTPPW